jgi:hypothetical protein
MKAPLFVWRTYLLEIRTGWEIITSCSDWNGSNRKWVIDICQGRHSTFDRTRGLPIWSFSRDMYVWSATSSAERESTLPSSSPKHKPWTSTRCCFWGVTCARNSGIDNALDTSWAIFWEWFRQDDLQDDLKWKKFELQSCRSRRKLQVSCKVYLHPSSHKKVALFTYQP